MVSLTVVARPTEYSCMTTRSEWSYKCHSEDRDMADEEGGKVSAAVGLSDMIKLLIEDRQKREDEYGAKRVRREAEMDQ